MYNSRYLHNSYKYILFPIFGISYHFLPSRLPHYLNLETRFTNLIYLAVNAMHAFSSSSSSVSISISI
jgi:hypothetical protein